MHESYVSNRPISTILSKTRPRIRTYDYANMPNNHGNHQGNIKGSIVEHMVYNWLKHTPEINILEHHEKYRKNNHGFIIQIESLEIEYDLIFEHEGITYVSEIKANGLNGLANKIPHMKQMANVAFGPQSRVALFFNFSGQKAETAKSIELTRPYAACINTKIRQNDLDFVVQKFSQKCR